MKVEVHRTTAPWSPAAERILRRSARRVEAMARRYPALWSELDVHVDAEGSVEQVRVMLVLDGDEVHADARGTDPAAVLEEAFASLFDRFDLYRLRANRSLRDRVERRRRERFQAMPHVPFVGEVVERLYPVLLRAAQHEIAIRQADGSLEPGLVDPVELADTVIADGMPSLSADLTLPDAANRLEARMAELLDRYESEQVDHEGEDVPLDDGTPDFAMSSLGEEIEDLWTLDEVAFDETLADPDRDVEEYWASADLRDVLTAVLFRLREADRRLFSQVVIDGWPVDGVAAAGGRRIEEVRNDVERIAHDLANRLSIGETTWSRERVREVYAALGARLRDERRDLPAVSRP